MSDVYVSASQVYARLVFVSVCDWFVGLLGVCLVLIVCEGVYLSLCVRPRICVSVSDRCVGSGLLSC